MTLSQVPRRGERVQVDGHTGVFIVVRIDKGDGCAILKLESNPATVLKHIPFSAITPLREDVNQAAARIVRESTERV